jgi:hypothetical protein
MIQFVFTGNNIHMLDINKMRETTFSGFILLRLYK